MGQDEGHEVFALLPLILISIPFAIGFYHLAGRLGRNKAAWAVLSLIPGVNYFFWVYGWFVVVLNVLDRLPPLTGRTGGRVGSQQTP